MAESLLGEATEDAGAATEESEGGPATESQPETEPTGEVEASGEREEGEDVADDRPEGCPDKFWDQANGIVRTESLIKSYLELEKKHSERQAGEKVPDKYEFAIPTYEELGDELEGISPDDFGAVTALLDEKCPFNMTMQKRAKETGLTQNQWEQFARSYVVEQARAHKLSEDHQRKVLLVEEGGDEKKLAARLAGLRQQVHGAYREEPEMKAIAHHTTQTAAGVKLLEEVFSGKLAQRMRDGGSPIPIPSEGATKRGLSVDDLRQMQASEKYLNGDQEIHRRVADGYQALESAGAL